MRLFFVIRAMRMIKPATDLGCNCSAIRSPDSGLGKGGPIAASVVATTAMVFAGCRNSLVGQLIFVSI